VTAEVDAAIDASPELSPQFKEKFKKTRWQQELARRGYERTSMSPDLSEALRKEIRTALDADGKPFDVNVARRVYDLAIAARDMCIAASSSVKDAIDQIKDTNGPMETLEDPNSPEAPLQASETFGARLIREVMATLPMLLRGGGSGEDPKALVHALADARMRGMHDVAEELEVKLFGRVLTGPRPVGTATAVNIGSFEHGFSDGKQGVPPDSDEPDYKEGWQRGTKERFLADARSTLASGDTGRPEDIEECPACGKAAGDSCDGPMSHPARRSAYDAVTAAHAAIEANDDQRHASLAGTNR
jgi:hypothetical protein